MQSQGFISQKGALMAEMPMEATDRQRLLVERMLSLTDEYRTAEEIAVACKSPRSSTYKMLRELELLGVVTTGVRSVQTENKRASTTKVYRLSKQNAEIYVAPVLGETIPRVFNRLSKKHYSLLDLAAAYDPSQETGGAKAANAYMVVATLLLELSFEDPSSVESIKKRLELRQYLQHALASAKNTVSSIEQMLNDPRLWNEHLHVLSVNEQVRANKDLIKSRSSRIDFTYSD